MSLRLKLVSEAAMGLCLSAGTASANTAST